MSGKAEVQPQRQIAGRGWVDCEPHQAHMWVARIGARVIGRYGNKALANEYLVSAILRKAGPTRRYQLGGVMPKSESAAIATSLNKAQYERTR
jgi:hypothetical protein